MIAPLSVKFMTPLSLPVPFNVPLHLPILPQVVPLPLFASSLCSLQLKKAPSCLNLRGILILVPLTLISQIHLTPWNLLWILLLIWIFPLLAEDRQGWSQ